MKNLKIELLKEWTPEQFKTVEKAILKYLKGHFVTTMHNVSLSNLKSFKDVDNALGLAYTSSGMFACYGVCNTQMYFDYHQKWSFNLFALGKSGFVYALLNDDDENEIYFPIN